MKFNELLKGKIYADKDGVNAYMFVKMRNENLATFLICEYDEEKSDYIATTEEVYLTANEIKNLVF